MTKSLIDPAFAEKVAGGRAVVLPAAPCCALLARAIYATMASSSSRL